MRPTSTVLLNTLPRLCCTHSRHPASLLACHLGVSEPHWSRVIRSQKPLRLDLAQRLADQLELTMAEITTPLSAVVAIAMLRDWVADGRAARFDDRVARLRQLVHACET